MTNTIHEIHGIRFDIDAYDLGEDEGVCIERAISNLNTLTAEQAASIAAAWADTDAEYNSRTSRDDVAMMVEKMEADAFSCAGEWVKDSAAYIGHCPMLEIHIYRG